MVFKDIGVLFLALQLRYQRAPKMVFNYGRKTVKWLGHLGTLFLYAIAPPVHYAGRGRGGESI